jgi:hypothetical protein
LKRDGCLTSTLLGANRSPRLGVYEDEGSGRVREDEMRGKSSPLRGSLK